MNFTYRTGQTNAIQDVQSAGDYVNPGSAQPVLKVEDLPREDVSRRASSVTDISMQSIVIRIQNAEAAALKILYEATAPRIYGLVLRITRNRSDANEILCDVYKAVWINAGAYDPARASVIGWLSVIARSRALDCLRSEVRRRKLHADFDGMMNLSRSTGDSCTNPDTFIEDPAIQRALSNLSKSSRHVIALAYIDGLTHPEIAEHTQLPLGTVKSLIRRGLTSIQRELETTA